MKRNDAAEASGAKPENRFAALTSGLLARKGHAAPSNSPIADPAEETDAFALEPTRKAEKKKPAAPPASAKEAIAKILPSAKPKAEAPAPPAKPEPLKSLSSPAPPKPAASPAPPKPPSTPAAAMTVINERSLEAGYPQNPSPEEIAALEAEADEVVSYFSNFGNDDAIAAEKEDFYGDAPQREQGDFDDAESSVPPPAAVAKGGPWAGASVPAVARDPVRAGVSVQLSAREFVRLTLGAAELELSAQDLIAEAIEEYLDARGVLSLGGCSCLEAVKKQIG